jgi:hypothetical protein
MDVTYSADIGDLDQAVQDAQAERPGKPIKIRLQPTIFRLRGAEATGGDHQAWKGVSWTLECQTAQEAIGLRETLRAFFTAVGAVGAGPVRHLLVTAGLTETEERGDPGASASDSSRSSALTLAD